MNNNDHKQEVLTPVLKRFAAILKETNHQAHEKYKQQLKKYGRASSIQLLTLNEKLSKTLSEKGKEIARETKPWLYPVNPDQVESDRGITAQCSSKQEIIIQYGIDPKLSAFANPDIHLANQPDSEKFIKFGNLTGELIPQKADLVPNKMGNNQAHFKYYPDEDNAIPFTLNDDGMAKIKGCSADKQYYVRIHPITNEEEVVKWLNGYQQVIDHLSQFLESEWENVHAPRWKIYDEEYQDAEDSYKDIPVTPVHPYLIAVSGDFIKGFGDNLVKITSDLWEWCFSSDNTEEKKEFYFFIQDEIYLYIITSALMYWYELLSPKDKAYQAGQVFFDFVFEVAKFIAESYVLGKAIPVVASLLSSTTVVASKKVVDLLKKGANIGAIEKAATDEVIGSIPERFFSFFKKNPLKVNLDNQVGGMTEAQVLKRSSKEVQEVNVITNAGEKEAIIEGFTEETVVNQESKNLAQQASRQSEETVTNLDPVSMLTGEELLTLIDDTFFSQFPFVWQRLYRTSAVEFNSGLGYGWSHSLCHSLTFTADNQVIWQNHENNLITFPLPTKSVPAITNLLSEAAIYLGHEPNHYVVSSEAGIYYFTRDNADLPTARLMAIGDKYGHQHRVVYGADNQLIALELSGGRQRVALSYSPTTPTLITQVSEQIRNSENQPWQFNRLIMQYEYNARQELISATNALNQTEQYEYDASHLIIQRQMAGGAVFNWQWQGTGKDAVCDRQITNLNGIESRYEWDAKSGKSVVYQSDGTTLSYIHNKQGKLISETNAAGQTTTYDYNDNGQLTRQTNPQGGETHYLYNEYHKLTTTVTPDGSVTHYYWWDNNISEVNQGKRRWQYRYNAYGDRTEEISPEGKKTGYQYNEHGQCTAIRYPDGTELTQRWDEQGRCIETVNPNGRTEHYQYDRRGQLTGITDSQGNTVSYLYDALGQIICITYPDKTTREYQYNAYGKVTRFKDETGKITEYEYASPLHLMTEKRLPNGEKLKFRYDNIHLQVSEIENQKGEVYHLRYTPTGQLSEEVGFDGIKTTYHYDVNGHLTEKHEYGDNHNAEPLITQYQRDATGRLTRRLFADGVTEQYEYDEYGQLIKVKDGDNVLVWEYNLDGQLTAEHQNWATIRHRYDNHSGQLIATKLPDGQLLEYHHRHGQLRGITLDGESITGILYDGSGRECERRQGNGLINRYRYNELGQLASHQVYRGFDITLNDAPVPVWQQQYQYEADGQLAEIRGNQPRRYRYDKAGQLQTVSYPDSQREQHHAEKTELFNYDQTGNKINEKQPLSAQAFAANIAKGNRLIFFSDKHFEYDRFGNLITEKRGKNRSLVTHYEYDCRHRLIKVIKPTGMIITYTYDPFNRRTSKTVNGKTTEFIWQGNKLIAETDNDKHWQSYIYEPDSFRPLALIKGNARQDKIQRYWYQNDQLGTPIRLTDSIGETLYQCEYNAYGQVIDEKYYSDNIDTLPDNPLRFQGQYYDEETGLHYNLNRYYDPLVGRYISQDPIKLIGGINFYQYCPNPVNWIDPLGFKGMPGAAKQTSKAKPNNTANATKPDEVPITQEEFDKIINTSKGDRLENVLEYLPEEYVKAHEALFEQQGGSFVIVEQWVTESEYSFYAPRRFVGLSSEMEQIVAEYKTAGNDWRILSNRLALGNKDLTDIHIYLIRIKPGDPRFSYKMPNGKEVGANGQWIPGGFTKGGIREAALEGSEVIKTDRTVETILKQFENWEQLQ